jgi:hypothetical protein
MTPYGPRRRPPAEPLDEPPQLSATDIAAMKKLEAAWRDYGGPSASDIFVEFGITPDEFYRRLNGQRRRTRDLHRPHGNQQPVNGSTSDCRDTRPPGPHLHGEGHTPQ